MPVDRANSRQDTTTQHPSPAYIGRFAPSPTGELHFGSLVAAVASHCDSLKQGGQWQLRIDDIDSPRCVEGAASSIQQTLESYGFEWSGTTLWQSKRIESYEVALRELISQGSIYYCSCSRRDLKGYRIYPGTCRMHSARPILNQPFLPPEDMALRCQLSGVVEQHDSIQTNRTVILDQEVGDVIVWRRDGLVSYALACAIDDAKVTTVVRGADLLQSTVSQIAIMQLLSLRPPTYAHFPVAIDKNGDKLSKHAKSTPVKDMDVVPTLLAAWNYLEQPAIDPADLADFWKQARQNWMMERVPATPKKTV